MHGTKGLSKKNVCPSAAGGEERKPIIYPITKKDMDDVMEHLIDTMRQQRVTEERKTLDEKRREVDGRKKLEAMREKRQAELKKGRAYVSSYDIRGSAVEVQAFSKFPIISPTCATSSRLLIPETPPHAANPIPRLSQQTKPSPAQDLGEQLRARVAKPSREAAELIQAAGAYEAITPAAGVTFSEAGKNPKASGVSVADKSGRPSKTSFYSSMADPLLRASMSMPTFFPNIKKGQKTLGIAMPVPSSLGTHFHQETVEERSLGNRSDTERRRVEQSLPDVGRSRASAEGSGMLSSGEDISSLLVDENYPHYRKGALSSIRPRPYVPPSFQRYKHLRLRSEDKPQEGKTVGPDPLFNVAEMLDGAATTRSEKPGPIILGGKPTSRLIRQSLGTRG